MRGRRPRILSLRLFILPRRSPGSATACRHTQHALQLQLARGAGVGGDVRRWVLTILTAPSKMRNRSGNPVFPIVFSAHRPRSDSQRRQHVRPAAGKHDRSQPKKPYPLPVERSATHPAPAKLSRSSIVSAVPGFETLLSLRLPRQAEDSSLLSSESEVLRTLTCFRALLRHSW